MQNIDQQLARFDQTTVLCVGDLMLDDFVYGEVARISPEAPTPVLAVSRNEVVAGPLPRRDHATETEGLVAPDRS